MQKISIRGCPICGEVRSEFIHSLNFLLPAGHPLGSGYDVLACERCGFCYADTTTTQQDYDAFYAQRSIYGSMVSTGGGESPWDAARLANTAACIAEAFPNKAGRIIDIGCANGGLLAALKKLGYSNLCGVDPSESCIFNLRDLHGIEGIVASLSEIPPDLEPADVVIFSHVLEHVQNLKLALAKAQGLMKSHGLFYIETPDAERYCEFAVAPFQDFNTEHINHFSLQCLEMLCNQGGFGMISRGKKTFESSPGNPYPAIYGFFSRQAGKVEWRRDENLVKRIRAYVEKSQQVMDKIDAEIERLIAQSRDVIVFGTGQLALKLLVETALSRANVIAFVDSNPINQGQIIGGVPILAPEKIQGLDYPIIVTSMLHCDEIVRLIRHHLRLNNPIIKLCSE